MVQILTPTRQKPKSFLQSIVGGAVDAIPEAVEKYQKMNQPTAKEKEIMLAHQLQGQNQQKLFSHQKDIEEFKQMGKQKQFEYQQDLKKSEEQVKREREKSSVRNLLMETGDYTPKQVDELSEVYDVPTARGLNLKKKEPSPYEPTSQKLAAERTNKYIDQVEVKGRAAEEKMRGLEEGMTLHKQGATGFKLTNFLADYFKIPSLADPGSKAFNASMKSQYSGIGDIVKGKVSNFEFDTFKQRIASAEDSPKAAEALMVSAMMESKIAAKERDLVNQKRQEYYEQGKSEPSNFDLQIQEELRPYADLILAQTNKELLNILNPTKKDSPNRQILDDIWGQ